MASIVTTQASDKRRPAPHQSTSPLLSVVTVVRNAEQTIERTLESVISQKGSAIEYLVIDGGSTDNTVSHIQQRAADIDYWHSKPDAGIAAAFNIGLELANGRYIAFLNADDWYAADALAAVQSQLLAEPHIEWLCGAINYQDPDSNFQRAEPAEPKMLSRYMSVYHPSMIVARTAYQRVGAYSETLAYAMDSEWVHRAIAAGVTPTTTASVIANMSLGGASNQNLAAALAEYRASVIKHGLSNPLSATYYLVRQWLVHSLLKWPLARALWPRGRQKEPPS